MLSCICFSDIEATKFLFYLLAFLLSYSIGKCFFPHSHYQVSLP